MNHLVFTETVESSYPICLLTARIHQKDIHQHYVVPHSLNADELLVLDVHHRAAGKRTPKAEIVQYINEELVPVLRDFEVEYLLVTDAEYFKALTKTAKVEVHLGYVMDCAFGPWKVVYLPSHLKIFYDPDKVKGQIATAIRTLNEHRFGNYQAPGTSIIKFAAYPMLPEEIEDWLERLIVEDRPLTCDIEAFSLKHHSAGIGTVTLCWSRHEGIAFPVDLGSDPQRVRKALRSFFLRFSQKIIYHGISYDVYVLIYQLFMKDILDTEGLLEGLSVMLRNWDCTKLITYLATNSCAGNQLGLKVQAQEFAGNYAVETIEDIRSIPLPQLLQYNLVDGLSTWYVYEKNHPKMVADQQTDVYKSLFRPAIWDIIQMQLTGMPVDMERVRQVRPILEADCAKALDTLLNSPLVQRYTDRLREKHVIDRNAKLVKKRITLLDAEVRAIVFNPNSAPQLQDFLYEFVGLPVIALSDSKLPSTKGKVLKALINHTTDPVTKEMLAALVDYKAVIKILNDFIPSLEGAVQGPDGWHYLFGNFNLGGTLSGRLSSSDPNLQNLPATGSRYATLIKSCFRAPPGWVFGGLDFSSLEDRISALTTKDPNKLKVYTDGYDGHCLRAYSYFTEDMPDIDPNSVDSINSIQKKYKAFRQESKVPTFLLTYDGTWRGMMQQCGFSAEKAQTIEARYKQLYKVSIDWISAKLDQAAKDGYVTVAFGLRVRTPLLKQVIRKTNKTPYEAEAEGRSAGNALGQSWCLLNSRAGSEFMGKVRASKYRLDIRPCAQIHDAQYFLIREDLAAIQYTNEHLVIAAEWQNHPDIEHPDVGLGGELSLFYPSWAEELVIPNKATDDQVIDLIAKHVEKIGQKP